MTSTTEYDGPSTSGDRRRGSVSGLSQQIGMVSDAKSVGTTVKLLEEWRRVRSPDPERTGRCDKKWESESTPLQWYDLLSLLSVPGTPRLGKTVE